MTTFRPPDLLALEALLEKASAVVPMEDIADGIADPHMIGLRHDCDNEIQSSVVLAAWEAERGFRSTFYVLHTAEYFADKPLLRSSLERIASYGHEIGIHNDAVTVALETGQDPAFILYDAIVELERYGHTIRSTVAHGNARCHVDKYVNDEMWVECRREEYGDISRFGFTPTPLADLGLDFDANWIRRGDYLSDSGGNWSQPFDQVVTAFPSKGQLHILQHPCWWSEAFERSSGDQLGEAFASGLKEAAA